MFEIVSWWKHKRKHSYVFCKKIFGFTFSFICKWNYTSNTFTADFSQNSTDNTLLGSNLRKDCHSLAELKLYGLTYGTPLIVWYHLAPCVMASFLTSTIKLSLTSAASVGWQSYLCPFNPAYLAAVVLPSCVLNLFSFWHSQLALSRSSFWLFWTFHPIISLNIAVFP